MNQASKEETVAFIPAPAFYDQNWDRLGKPGKHAYYKALEAGQIPNIRIGRKILVRADALEIMAERAVGEQHDALRFEAERNTGNGSCEKT